MLQAFIDKYLITEFYSIHVHISENDTIFHLLRLKKRKSEITILKQESIIGIDEIFEKLQKNIPVILVFTGKKIISKILSPEANYMGKILFNKDPENYYILEYNKSNHTLVSVIRKDDLDYYIKTFLDKGFSVLDFSIGPFTLENLDPFLAEPKIILTKEFEYDLKNTLLSYNTRQEISDLVDIQIGSEIIYNKHILGFAGFLDFLNPNQVVKNYQPDVDAYIESYSFKRAFTVLGKVVLISFLILLFSSYIIKSIYSQKSSEIQQETSINNQVLDQIVLLKKDKEYKSSTISNSSLGSKHLLSFYIAHIAENLPEDIILEKLEVYPLKQPLDPNKKIIIEPNVIVIEGITPSKSSVTKWVEMLYSYDWIRKVEVSSYEFLKNEYVFTLKLQI